MPALRLRSVGYAVLTGYGLLAIASPRLAITVKGWLLLVAFDNPGDLEPREWLESTTRVAGVGMVAAGLTGLALERTRESDAVTLDVEQAEAELGNGSDHGADAVVDSDGE
jgi:hypothetical protein